MRFSTTHLQDVRVIEMAPVNDQRGFFTRTFCAREFAEAGLASGFVQQSMSLTIRKGTLRGIHYQRFPHEEIKLIRCLGGAIYDVLIDLRPASSTYLHWEAYELAAGDGRQLYAPSGFAHGFQTLVSNTEVGYMITEYYEPKAACGVRYDDPAFGISWPLPVSDISTKDLNWPYFSRVQERNLPTDVQQI